MKYVKYASHKKGLPAGAAIYVGKTQPKDSVFTLVHYTNENYFIKHNPSEAEIEETLKVIEGKTWINVEGLGNIAAIESLCAQLQIHPLVVEDILNTHQRPKVDFYEDYLFLVMKMHVEGSKGNVLKLEQFSMIVKQNVILTFKESTSNIFEIVCNRLSNPKSRLYQYGVDYLAYALIDAIVDDYFALIESKGELLENLEQELIENPPANILKKIYVFKRYLLDLNKNVRPLREIFSSLQRDDNIIFSASIQVYLKDLFDHVLRILEYIDTYREITTNMQDIYLSTQNNKMNETMKILTMFASIFIPLSFIASLYGMNFKHMPELQWKYGYLMVWIIILLVASGLLWFFKRKKWF